ncbi:hypothetical protein [Sulfitobacter guttiformis]|uniref:Uncharacterized protein n=1 Tax=Sulfitobacter guttiformis TaxID=74349 RepID=A0A420DP10_9RHOB|nr:hypothetical protein [Sulfitobacter guttiformis]KIN73268.1 hypothetical protein Z949_2457 [Sulfitobacter guttiformis KCTC 32187]RKE95940.1 hypothetical protein C8N30_0487 [Sulfitobacter guttiformis]
MKKRACANSATLPDASSQVIRDMILIALDATEAPDLSERNRLEAHSALTEAMILIEGGSQ